MARLLIDRGFTLVRPLAGGIDGWEEAGYQVESQPLVAITPPPTGSFPRPITGTAPRPKQ